MNDNQDNAATKREILLRLLGLGKVMVHLDARNPRVDVPAQFRADPDLRLNISYRFQYGDLVVEADDLHATLSFSGRPYVCKVPLRSIFAMVSHVSGESFFFPTEAPAEALVGFAAMMGSLADENDEGPDQSATHDRAKRMLSEVYPRLRAIDGGSSKSSSPKISLLQNESRSSQNLLEEENNDTENSDSDGKVKKIRHLRLVK